MRGERESRSTRISSGATPTAVREELSEGRPRGLPVYSAAIALILLNVLVFAQVRHFDFVNYDDPEYVAFNSMVARGLSSAGFVWAWTTVYLANWHPVTWLSHMLDVELWGMNAGSHHMVNLAIHCANSLLLFYALLLLTSQVGRSLFAAALFAAHPLHVQPVVWIAERKELLAAFFGILAIIAYQKYVQRPLLVRYSAIAFLLALSLLSKPMLVTLPFLLLILDFWPLNRWSLDEPWPSLSAKLFHLAREKAPLLILSILSSVITVIVQQKGGALLTVEQVPVGLRFANAALSYVIYLGDVFWPAHLAAFYPLPKAIPAWQALGALLLLAAISIWTLWQARRNKFVAAGWFWYLGALIPVVGIVHVGEQARADRYTYFPLIGIFVVLAWSGALLLERWLVPLSIQWMTAAGLICVLAVVATSQARYWRNGEQLWSHALQVDQNNFLAHNNLGYFYWTHGRTAEAIPHYREAIRDKPSYPHAYNNLAAALARSGRLEEAIAQVSAAIRLAPDLAEAHSNLGGFLMMQGKSEEAANHYEQALRLDPALADAHSNFGLLFARRGDWESAVAHYREALRLKPDLNQARNNLGLALGEQGKLDEAVSQYQQVLRFDPSNRIARERLARLQAGSDPDMAPRN